MKKIFTFFVFVVLSFSAYSQTTILYSEDFSDASLNNRGQNGTTFDMSGVTNWTLGLPSPFNGDFAKQSNGGVFEVQEPEVNEANGVKWYSLEVDISCYDNVSLSLSMGASYQHSSSGVRAYYILNGGSLVQFGSLVGNATSPSNASVSGLTGNTIQIVLNYWGTYSNRRYFHDNVLITGEYSATLCPISSGAPACGGFLTDSDAGTAAGNYANNVNYTSTVCPSTPGELTTVMFEGLDIGAGDVLTIYEGSDNTGSTLGTVNSSTAVGFSVSSYDCITFEWITNGTDNSNEGFWASILCDVVSVNPEAADDFANAPLICDLTTYSGSTAGNTEDNPGNMSGGGDCPTLFGGTLENNSWFKFVATSTSISMEFTPSSCNSGGGIQAAILAYDGTNFTRVSECNYSDGTQSSPFTLTAFEAPLVIGDTYYVMVDGNAGSTCNYDIDIQSGFTAPIVTATPNPVCEGDPATLTVENSPSNNLIWFASDPAFGSDYGSPLIVNPTTTTTYTVLTQGECAGKTAEVTVTTQQCCQADAGTWNP